MDRVRCAQCGMEHDLGDVEPSFDRPDAYFEVPDEARAERTWNAQGLCIIRAHEGWPARHFIRCLLCVPIRGGGDICWGIWAEVDEEGFELVRAHWDDADQFTLPPLSGTLANQLPAMAPTLGLQGEVRLVSPSQYPSFTLDADSGHPLAAEQREGIYEERALEWRASAYHA